LILITGASGFLGQHLVKRLSQEKQLVRAIYFNTLPSQELQHLPGITWHKANLLDVYDVEEMMRGVQEVYHCAAIVSFDKNDQAQLFHFNTEATANVVNAALNEKVRKLLFVSSVASLGRAATGKEITEETEWEDSKANSVYAQSKYYAEMEVWRGIAEGLNAVIINPGIILGEGNWEKGSARLIKTADKEFPFYTEGINAWVDVEDVAEIAVTLMKSDVENERFIVSAGNFAYKDIFTLMAKALGKKPPHIKAGKWLTGLVWRMNALKKIVTHNKTTITKETAATAQKKVYYNNKKLLETLTNFTYTPLEHTIERMAKSYAQQKSM